MKIKSLILLGMMLALLVSLVACTPGPNELTQVENAEGELAGFWQGLWHGFIALFTFLISLFSDSVGVYEVHNNGGWYNFGFIFGVMLFFGGSGSGGCRSRSRRR